MSESDRESTMADRNPRAPSGDDLATTWSDQDLVLAAYGEIADPGAFSRDLAASPALARRYASWLEVIDTLGLDCLPEPTTAGDDAAARWARLAPRLADPNAVDRFAIPRDAPVLPHGSSASPASPLSQRGGVAPGQPVRRRERFGGQIAWPRLVAYLAAAGLLLAAGFLAGRLGPTRPTELALGPTAANYGESELAAAAAALPALPREARERILAAAVAGHLERSESLLLELANGTVDPVIEANRALVLTAANRLYRGAAAQAGASDVANLLSELERLLLEVAHLPADADAVAVRALGERLADADLLFKVRIVEARMRERSTVFPRGSARADAPGATSPGDRSVPHTSSPAPRRPAAGRLGAGESTDHRPTTYHATARA